MTKPLIRIGIVSDVVCPWCYIGKRRLEKAMAIAGNRFDFELEYFPFELNPHMPAEGKDQQEYLTEKFGGPDKYRQMTDHVTRVALQEGLFFNFEKQKISPNTRNAQRLIMLAKEDGKQLELVEILFKAYFTDGVDLSKTENLTDLASHAGLDPEKIELFLQSNTGSTEIEMAEQELQKLGITGVPLFIIDNKFGISGAQSPEAFIQAFEDAVSEIYPEGVDPAHRENS